MTTLLLLLGLFAVSADGVLTPDRPAEIDFVKEGPQVSLGNANWRGVVGGYESARRHLLEDEHGPFIRGVAVGGKPLAADAELAPADAALLDQLAAVHRDLTDAAYGEIITARHDGHLAVQLIFEHTQPLAEKHGVAGDRRFVTDNGRLYVTMLKIGDRWYWQPAG